MFITVFTEPGTRPYPEPDESSPPILILFSHLHLGIPSSFFISGFPTKILYEFLISSIRATCPAHIILLDLITQIIFDNVYSL